MYTFVRKKLSSPLPVFSLNYPLHLQQKYEYGLKINRNEFFVSNLDNF